MKTHNAWICCNCDEVFEDASLGRCPVCESKSVLSLSRIINGTDNKIIKETTLGPFGRYLKRMSESPKLKEMQV